MGSMRSVIAAAGGLLVVAGCNLGTPAVRHPGPSEAVAVADVDADGDLDVVAGGAGGGLTLLNDGGGALSGTPHAAATEVRAVAIGDVDGDGAVDRLDVLGSGVDLALGDGSGGFSVPVPVPGDPPGDVINDATLADLDADGDLDLVTAGSGGSGGGRFRLNDGAGAFGPLRIPGIPCGAASTGYVPFVGETVGAIDLDADDDLDIAWTGYCDKPDSDVPYYGIAFNDGPATFSRGVQGGLALSGRRVGLAYADVDEDGHLDRIVGDPDSPVVQITIGRDPHAPGPTPPDVVLSVPTPAPVTGGLATDVDGDGHVDLVVTAPGSGTATVLYGDGAGGFPDRHPLVTGGSSIESVEAADLDDDGRTDLVFGTDNTGGGQSPSVAVLWNRLDGREH